MSCTAEVQGSLLSPGKSIRLERRLEWKHKLGLQPGGLRNWRALGPEKPERIQEDKVAHLTVVRIQKVVPLYVRQFGCRQ